VLMVGVGVPTSSTTVATVSQCVIPAAAAGTAQQTGCGPADQPTPASIAGLLPGDTIVGFNGTPVTSWGQLTDLIRASAGMTIQLDYVRDGLQTTKAVTIVENQRPVINDLGEQIGVEPAGFLGISVTAPYVQQSVGTAFVMTGDLIAQTAKGVVALPARIPALWNSVFNDAPRDLNSPIGIVGVGRIGGEILDSDNTSQTDKIVLFLRLLAGFNLSLFMLNMLPLLPLDGGHILGAMIEWVRKGWAKVRGKRDPGPFDVAKLMPVAYVVVLLFIGLSLLTLAADIFNPVKLFG